MKKKIVRYKLINGSKFYESFYHKLGTFSMFPSQLHEGDVSPGRGVGLVIFVYYDVIDVEILLALVRLVTFVVEVTETHEEIVFVADAKFNGN